MEWAAAALGATSATSLPRARNLEWKILTSRTLCTHEYRAMGSWVDGSGCGERCGRGEPRQELQRQNCTDTSDKPYKTPQSERTKIVNTPVEKPIVTRNWLPLQHKSCRLREVAGEGVREMGMGLQKGTYLRPRAFLRKVRQKVGQKSRGHSCERPSRLELA